MLGKIISGLKKYRERILEEEEEIKNYFNEQRDLVQSQLINARCPFHPIMESAHQINNLESELWTLNQEEEELFKYRKKKFKNKVRVGVMIGITSLFMTLYSTGIINCSDSQDYNTLENQIQQEQVVDENMHLKPKLKGFEYELKQYPPEN